MSLEGAVGYFITTDGQCSSFSLAPTPSGDDPKGIRIPAGAKGYVVFFADDLSLSATGSYDPNAALILKPGLRINNAKIDPAKNQSIVLDDFFFFGISNSNAPSNIAIKGVLTAITEQPTVSPTTEETQAPDHGSDPQGDLLLPIIIAVAVLGVVTAVLVIKNKASNKRS